MNLSVGIVGLPNVGKSTLFNALLKKQQALAANYPFATIEPNVGIVPVPDSRLIQLAEITKDEEKMPELPPLKPATVEFVDIAGLVKGASEGAGLGNKFLSHIREVSVIAHVVRAFEDPSASSGQAAEIIIREGSIDPKTDYETIQTELILADLSTIAKIKNQKAKIQIKGQKEAAEKLFEGLNKGIAARDVVLTDEEREAMRDMFLLTNKPEIIVLNVTENEYNADSIAKIEDRFTRLLTPGRSDGGQVVICAKIESELAGLSADDQQIYLAELGVGASGLERLIKKAYERLGLISFLTAGEKEVRAWTVKKGSSAPMAAGEIHTDFIKKFIKAEVISFDDYIATGGRKKAREVGKARLEGKDYIVEDGDVIEFKIGA
ncbi:MAG: redox-regulated ATPase YchF [Candidatus Levybacteria bacterium]|nr:redox-regulated ATPase YchF [Candidatus Levybacteria bacterium]